MKFFKGQEVIALNVCIGSNSETPLIKKDENLIVKGFCEDKIWFTTTGEGYGCYPIENFVSLEEYNKLNKTQSYEVY